MLFEKFHKISQNWQLSKKVNINSKLNNIFKNIHRTKEENSENLHVRQDQSNVQKQKASSTSIETFLLAGRPCGNSLRRVRICWRSSSETRTRAAVEEHCIRLRIEQCNNLDAFGYELIWEIQRVPSIFTQKLSSNQGT